MSQDYYLKNINLYRIVIFCLFNQIVFRETLPGSLFKETIVIVLFSAKQNSDINHS